MEQGEAIDIIRLNDDGKPECVLENMASVFLNEGHRNIATVSVNGAFRKGKSFLLNMFLNFMKNPDYKSWNNTIYQGFKSSGGLQPVTRGIQVWSQPFRSLDKNGEEILIYLLDIEGLFDTASCSATDHSLFALSSLISSVQIHFFSSPLASNELDYFNFFVSFAQDYAKLASASPFQDLILYFRDWIYPEDYPFGFEGGRNYMQKIFNELKDVDLGKSIKKTFDTKCFLMPHPGERVAQSKFDGKTKSINREYLNSADELTKGIFSPGNVKTKSFNGQAVTGQQFYDQLKDVVAWFRSGRSSDPSSLFASFVERIAEAAVEDTTEYYFSTITQRIEDTERLGFQNLFDMHTYLAEDCLDFYRQEMQCYASVESVFNKYEEKLQSHLSNEYENLSKERDMLEMQNLQSRNLILCRFTAVKESLVMSHAKWVEQRILLITKLTNAATELESLKTNGMRWKLGLDISGAFLGIGATIGAFMLTGPLVPVAVAGAIVVPMATIAAQGLVQKSHEEEKLKFIKEILGSTECDTKLLKNMSNDSLKMLDLLNELQDLLDEKCSCFPTSWESSILNYIEPLNSAIDPIAKMISESENIENMINENLSGGAEQAKNSQDEPDCSEPFEEFARIPRPAPWDSTSNGPNPRGNLNGPGPPGGRANGPGPGGRANGPGPGGRANGPGPGSRANGPRLGGRGNIPKGPGPGAIPKGPRPGGRAKSSGPGNTSKASGRGTATKALKGPRLGKGFKPKGPRNSRRPGPNRGANEGASNRISYATIALAVLIHAYDLYKVGKSIYDLTQDDKDALSNYFVSTKEQFETDLKKLGEILKTIISPPNPD